MDKLPLLATCQFHSPSEVPIDLYIHDHIQTQILFIIYKEVFLNA